MNATIEQHLARTYFREYQGLRDELLKLLTNEDLAYRVAPATSSLGELCREIGEIEHAYAESFRSFRLDLAYRNPDPEVEHNVAALSTWYGQLDRELMTALEGLTEADTANRRIVRGDFDIDDFAPLPTIQLDIYREALLIFYGKVSVYLRALGKTLPPRWEQWIG